jgi:hypothetical protein
MTSLPIRAWTAGALEVRRKDAVDFEPAFLVDGDNVTVDSIPLCPGVTINYAWHATANEMTLDFTDGGEGCSGAVALFNGTWRR